VVGGDDDGKEYLVVGGDDDLKWVEVNEELDQWIFAEEIPLDKVMLVL